MSIHWVYIWEDVHILQERTTFTRGNVNSQLFFFKIIKILIRYLPYSLLRWIELESYFRCCSEKILEYFCTFKAYAFLLCSTVRSEITYIVCYFQWRVYFL